jgi:anti-sigma regulatory factor (Ser/Thr protein kinase)
MTLPEPRRGAQPVAPRPATFRRSLPRSPGSPLLARGILREALRRFPEETVEAAQLMLSELVTNVLMHARTALQLEIEIRTESVRVTVEDSSADLPRPSPSEASGGLGLMIVDALSTTWGWDRTPFGKRVWFEVEGHRMPAQRAARPR